MQFLRKSIQRRLFLVFLVLAVVPLLLVGLVFVGRSYSVQRRQTLNLQDEVARRVATQVEAFIHERETELHVTHRIRRFDDLSRDERQAVLAELLAYQSAFDSIILLSAQGEELTSVSRLSVYLPVRDWVQTDEFMIPYQTRRTYYGPIEVDRVTNQLIMLISVPVDDPLTGEITMVLVAELRLRFINAVLRNIETSNDVYLIDSQERVVAHPDSSVVQNGARFRVPDEAGITTGLKGDRVVLAFSRIELGEQSLIVAAEEPVSEALALALNSIYLLAAVLVVAVLLSLVLGYPLIRRIVQPIRELAAVAHSIEAGNLNQQASVTTQDEIGMLAATFNSMTQQLRHTVATLEQRVAERTRDIQLAMEVTQQTSALLDIDQLLNAVAHLTRSSFNLYAVHIYLTDASRKKLILTAGSREIEGISEGEKAPIALDSNQLVAQAARAHATIIINDVKNDVYYIPNPQLPETESEMVVPIVRSGQVIGILHFQSREQNRFTENDVRVMTTLAGHIAVEIENAHLFTEQLQVTEELRALDKLKTQFLASMSHELRTPLNAILNFTQHVLTETYGPINEQQSETLEKVVESGEHLLSLINDLLDLSKIEAGMLQLFIQDVDLNQVVQRVMDTVEGLDRSPQIEIRQEIHQTLPTVKGDNRRIRQILLNLMSNAVKFTEKGSIILKAEVSANAVTFSVTDTGAGIPPQDMELVFEPFQQASEGLRKASGTGLGLPISKYLAEAHGGQLWVESTPGVGSTFYFSLPLSRDQ